MAIIFPGEMVAPTKPDLESIESFDNTVVGGTEKYNTVNANVIDVSEVVAKAGDTMAGRLTITSGGLRLTGGDLDVTRTAVADSYTTTDQVIVAVTDTSAPRTITIATAMMYAGRILIIKDESGGAAAQNITVATEGAEDIDGADTQTISANYGVLRLYSSGSHWFTF